MFRWRLSRAEVTIVSPSLKQVYVVHVWCGMYDAFFQGVCCDDSRGLCVGVVYGWGKNSFGQLGLNHQSNQNVPLPLKTLRSVRIKYISCGEDFSVFLTEVSRLVWVLWEVLRRWL